MNWRITQKSPFSGEWFRFCSFSKSFLRINFASGQFRNVEAELNNKHAIFQSHGFSVEPKLRSDQALVGPELRLQGWCRAWGSDYVVGEGGVKVVTWKMPLYTVWRSAGFPDRCVSDSGCYFSQIFLFGSNLSAVGKLDNVSYERLIHGTGLAKSRSVTCANADLFP